MKSLCLAAVSALLLATAPLHVHATAFDVNLIVNGDAENGTQGWQTFDDVPALAAIDYSSTSAFLYPDAPHGNRLFVGSAGGLAAGWQQVDLHDNAADIDAGRIAFKLDAYLGGVSNQEDNPLFYVSFLDASGSEIGHTELGPIFNDLRDNLTVLGGFHTSGWLPGGTRGLLFSLSMDAPDGDSTGAYADNLSFQLTAAVPEPQTWALMALGLAAVGVGARRRSR